MTDLDKIILKAKKLYRMGCENTNEGEIARRQLNKLKELHGLRDSMILPVYKKDILIHDKTLPLSSTQEILIIKIGRMCGNTVLFDETNQTWTISYRGNDSTISNAEKIISFIDSFTDDMIEAILKSNIPATLEQTRLEPESIKIGLVAKITNIIVRDVEEISVVLDKGEVEPQPGIDEPPEEMDENNISLERVRYDKEALEMAANLINDLHVIPVISYVREILNN